MRRDGENVDAPTRERDDEKTTEAFSDHTEMDPKVWNKLVHCDLLEKIITRLPLRNIVQSQLLSKEWRSRFQSPSFQKEVNILSFTWGPCNTYHPLCLTEKGLCGYDRSAQKWRDLCTLPEFPPEFNEIEIDDVRSRWRLWGTNCCLVVGALVILGRVFNNDLHIFVTNAVNKTIRRCPPVKLPLERLFQYSESRSILEFLRFFVLPGGHNHYKLVIVAYEVGPQEAFIIKVRVYDSKLDSWTEFQYITPNEWRPNDNGVCVKGVVYMPNIASPGGATVLCTFDVEKGLFEQFIVPESDDAYWACLVAFRSQLVLISYNEAELTTEGVYVFTVDLETLELTEILRGPARNFEGWLSSGIVIADDECIHLVLEMATLGDIYNPLTGEIDDPGFFRDVEGRRFDIRVMHERFYLVSCDLAKQLWSYSLVDSQESGYSRDERIDLSIKSAFQPNLSPFMLA